MEIAEIVNIDELIPQIAYILKIKYNIKIINIKKLRIIKYM